MANAILTAANNFIADLNATKTNLQQSGLIPVGQGAGSPAAPTPAAIQQIENRGNISQFLQDNALWIVGAIFAVSIFLVVIWSKRG